MSFVQRTLKRTLTTRSRQTRLAEVQRDFLAGLALEELSPYAGAMNDVETFYGTPPTWSSREHDRPIERGRLLLQYAYQQATATAPAEPVIALDWLENRGVGGRHLDLGSGVGLTTQLFVHRGWRSSLAEVSAPVLDFARFRLGRRDVDADMIDLSVDKELPRNRFEAITAFGALIHVGDVDSAAQVVCRALAPRGVLFLERSRLSTPDQRHRVGLALRRSGLRPLRVTPHVTAYRAT